MNGRRKGKRMQGSFVMIEKTAWVSRDRLTGLYIGRDGKLTRFLSRAALFTTRKVARLAAERFSAKYGVQMSTKHCAKVTIRIGAAIAAA
jgi:hypothetical protein